MTYSGRGAPDIALAPRSMMLELRHIVEGFRNRVTKPWRCRLHRLPTADNLRYSAAVGELDATVYALIAERRAALALTPHAPVVNPIPYTHAGPHFLGTRGGPKTYHSIPFTHASPRSSRTRG